MAVRGQGDTVTRRSIQPGILALALALTACGSSRDQQKQVPEPAPTAAPEPGQPDPFASARGVTIDPDAAKALPADTAGAFTIADLPHLVTQLGLGVTNSDLVQALRAELARVIGFDLLDPAAATAAGVRTDAPVTLAWLDHDARQLALVVTVADATKLEAALSGRPLLVRGTRAIIPLGERGQQTLQRLTSSPSSLAASGRLEVMDQVQFGADAALYLGDSASPALAGASGTGVGFTVRDDAVLLRAVTLFPGDAPTPGSFAKIASHALGASDIYAQPDFHHPLLASLLIGGPALSFGSGAPLDHFVPATGPSVAADPPGTSSDELAEIDQKIRAFEVSYLPGVATARARLVDALGITALRAGRIEKGLAYYGALVFRNTKTTEVAARALALWQQRTQSKNAVALAELQKKRALAVAKTQALNAGVLAQMKDLDDAAFATLTGSADFGSGLDDADVYGGLLGDPVGSANGGLGRSGRGAGGGGTGYGTIGTGKYGVIGHGSGGGGTGYGSGSGGMRGRHSDPKVRIGNSAVQGDLDKNIIRRYVRRQLPQIRYCYEKQLLTDPKLAGTVRVHFVIGVNGAVTSASASGISKEVSSCVARAVRAIRFPKPKGGGVVEVTYPFRFKSA